MKWPKASPIYPEYSNQWIVEELNGKPYAWNKRPGDKFYIDTDVEQDLMECIEYWKDKALYDYLRKSLPDEVNKACAPGDA